MQDERGVDGVIITDGSEDKKKVRIGNKMAAEKSKVSEHEAGSQAQDVHDRNAKKMALASNTKARDDKYNLIQLSTLTCHIHTHSDSNSKSQSHIVIVTVVA